MILITVFGRVATGKSILTDELARSIPAVVFRKDAVKELAFDLLGYGDREWSRALGGFSIELVVSQAIEAARQGIPCVIEGNFTSETVRSLVLQTTGYVQNVLVRCSASDSVVLQRFARRSRSTERHPGHGDDAILNEYEDRIPAAPEWPNVDAIRFDYIASDAQALTDVVRNIRVLFQQAKLGEG